MNIKKKWSGITITNAAEKYLDHLIKKNNNCIGIQINIKKSGCAGFRYNLSLIKHKYSEDKSSFYVYCKNNINIYISFQDMLLMDKTEIDFVTTDGINMHIKFNNPNIHTYCGCGDSFSIIKKK
ncbi:iron-sulfur cluster assembly accessory protein [Buchnera aphidicola]|uniref:Iron-sulfur cluster assembly accessory protein n=1 Tax=Buchnera aphidicola (Sarucallis kahawaluokalani) TaxID=1241878 RepID=A0A4D6YJJ0_9GAMM|nr:iron-sulfur cluster assembly accessory protein [Buchnera aphidicola]QCI25888.1 iron-sulfur cluster assembly accessory protein [Buchnera aphidicola (Sarucallis kahawaluokalani)]